MQKDEGIWRGDSDRLDGVNSGLIVASETRIDQQKIFKIVYTYYLFRKKTRTYKR